MTIEHDDELADFGGEADVAVVSVTVAMHVASLALLHRSGAAAKPTARAAAIVRARMRRRGAIDVAELLAGRPGTRAFAKALDTAAAAAAERIAAAPRTQLARAVGRAGAAELVALGAKACLAGGKLRAADVEALALHLEQGAELSVGLGRGRVFLRQPSPPHKQLEAEISRLPDPRRRDRVRVRKARRRGAAARETGVPATLVLITNAGLQEVRVSREGRDDAGALVLDSATTRLTATLRSTELVVVPSEPDPALVTRAQQATDWSSAHREVQADPLLAELVGELYTHAGFGGSAEILRALLALAPLIHESEAVARRFIASLPDTIADPDREIVRPLEQCLLDARTKP